MDRLDLQGWDIGTTDDFFNTVCEYIHEHNFDEQYIPVVKDDVFELDDVILEIRNKDELLGEIGHLDDDIVFVHYETGAMYSRYCSFQLDELQFLTSHVTDTYEEFSS